VVARPPYPKKYARRIHLLTEPSRRNVSGQTHKQAEHLLLQTGDEAGIAKAHINRSNTLSFIEGDDRAKSPAEAKQRKDGAPDPPPDRAEGGSGPYPAPAPCVHTNVAKVDGITPGIASDAITAWQRTVTMWLATGCGKIPYSSRKLPCYAIDKSVFRCVRNIAYKPLVLLVDWMEEPQPGAGFCKFPCFFPVSREFEVETGSHGTASSGTQSRLHVEPPDVGNIRDISGH
jgi:hypothetical protein